MTAASEHALVSDREPLQHRTLVVYEASGLESEKFSYIVRSLLSEGRLRYPTVIKRDGELETVMIEREGPTNLITTTTALRLHDENETRLLRSPPTRRPSRRPRCSRRLLRRTTATSPTTAAGVRCSAGSSSSANPLLTRDSELVGLLVPSSLVRLRCARNATGETKAPRIAGALGGVSASGPLQPERPGHAGRLRPFSSRVGDADPPIHRHRRRAWAQRVARLAGGRHECSLSLSGKGGVRRRVGRATGPRPSGERVAPVRGRLLSGVSEPDRISRDCGGSSPVRSRSR
jgi:hypothetical protein